MNSFCVERGQGKNRAFMVDSLMVCTHIDLVSQLFAFVKVKSVLFVLNQFVNTIV